jgi:hypothetical protein
MDVERTMEFILQMQAKSEERMAKAEARMDRADARMEKFDRRMEAMRKLVETGMRWLVKIEKTQQLLAEEVRALTEAQRKTDRKFDRLIDSWGKRRSNGHRPRS